MSKSQKKPPKPKKPANQAAPQRPVKYDKLEVKIHAGEKAITAAKAMDLLGWEVERQQTDSDPGTHFGETFDFTDTTGAKVRCWNNSRNRPFDKAKALEYAQDILNRRWAGPNGTGGTVNGETLIIGRTAEVISGQKRLAAVAFAKQLWESDAQGSHWKDLWPTEPVMDTTIFYGVDEDDRTVRTIDNVQPRSDADVLYTSHYFADQPPADRRALSRITGYAVSLLWDRAGWKDPKGFNSYSARRTRSATIGFIDAHPKLIQAVKHIYGENKHSGVARYLSPGYASAVLYLMATSRSDGDLYRNAEPPSEKKLDLSQWSRALEFWATLARESPKSSGPLKAVRLARRPLEGDAKGGEYSGRVFPSNPGEAAYAGPLEERLAVLALAWEAFAAGQKVTPSTVELLFYCDWRDDDTLDWCELAEASSFGGIDLGGFKREAPSPDAEESPSDGEADDEELTPEEVEERKAALAPPPDDDEDPAAERRRRAERIAAGIQERRARKAAANGAAAEPTPEEPKSLEDQLNDIREQHPGKVLLFKGAGVYYGWGDDARTLSTVLKVTVNTSTGLQRAQFPVSQLDAYLGKLQAAGYQCALVDSTPEGAVVKDIKADNADASPADKPPKKHPKPRQRAAK